ncbi:MAG: AzlC family ABC transporter permease [Arhodomonas sp.]|nr:AzlC family ABC transporter permease [Arhodomonas sp.]
MPLGIVFGVPVGVRLGHPGWYAVAMSVLVFAGAAQFMAVTLLAAGAGGCRDPRRPRWWSMPGISSMASPSVRTYRPAGPGPLRLSGVCPHR